MATFFRADGTPVPEVKDRHRPHWERWAIAAITAAIGTALVVARRFGLLMVIVTIGLCATASAQTVPVPPPALEWPDATPAPGAVQAFAVCTATLATLMPPEKAAKECRKAAKDSRPADCGGWNPFTLPAGCMYTQIGGYYGGGYVMPYRQYNYGGGAYVTPYGGGGYRPPPTGEQAVPREAPPEGARPRHR